MAKKKKSRAGGERPATDAEVSPSTDSPLPVIPEKKRPALLALTAIVFVAWLAYLTYVAFNA